MNMTELEDLRERVLNCFNLASPTDCATRAAIDRVFDDVEDPLQLALLSGANAARCARGETCDIGSEHWRLNGSTWEHLNCGMASQPATS